MKHYLLGGMKKKRVELVRLHTKTILQRAAYLCGQCPEIDDYFQQKPCFVAKGV